ncbi:3-isopropylmalate dehydratase small subunit [Pseudorhodoferax sp. Leaf274]|uniref:3-isopropylmalate dehydratase small subunit n=1 Tax=Pseudorhodoferax sp. Leaf274 TaxID=1736318 RepID=UPI000703ACB9|nr:3-isopropylmalate dehydratase small subunit [Pseudorhodoferax sp. Leaf274]KQP46268.1 hypothetical protein ASF44_25110 [Pseudorhodoferax sp. Leaf274]
MTPFTRLQSVAAPMPDADIDTDIIFPGRFLVLTQKAGLGPYAFYEKRFDEQGRERPDFVLHRPRWRGAAILVAGPNFGCGSSREQAPWALADLGLRCIIAPGFGEIFHANCLHNGLLPIRLAGAEHARVLAAAEAGEVLTVDLTACTVTLPDGGAVAFSIPERSRQSLLQGLDEIARIQQDAGARIAEFEVQQRLRQPWLYADAAAD